MKYRDSVGNTYKVDTIGLNGDGHMNYGVINVGLDETETNVMSIIPSSNKYEVEAALVEYAKEKELMPDLIYKIKEGERVIQGEGKMVGDFIKINDEIKAKEFDKYLGHLSRIAALEAGSKSEVEAIKKSYKDKVEAEEAELESIESIVRTGTVKEECLASWERDLENGIMLHIRHDNLKVLAWRTMNETEAQVCMDDQEAQADNEDTNE